MAFCVSRTNPSSSPPLTPGIPPLKNNHDTLPTKFNQSYKLIELHKAKYLIVTHCLYLHCLLFGIIVVHLEEL